MSSSVSGVTSSNSSSIYGTRNVLSGLATGLDTESMIENAVSGYNTKISSLQQQQTKLTWKQEAYRDITDPMVQFSRKYTSYTSSTNLYSASFFNNAVTTTTNGTNADKVSASGKTTSDIQILGVDSLATKTTYSVGFGGTSGSDETPTITGTSVDDLAQAMSLSAVSGTLTLSYNNKTIDLTFDDLPAYSSMSEFCEAINDQLADAPYTTSDGDSVAASTMIEASYDSGSGQITFTNKQSNGASVTISSSSGDLTSTLNIDEDNATLSLADGKTMELANGSVGLYLSQKPISVTLDGVTKTIKLPAYTDDEAVSDYIGELNASLKTAFGTTTDGVNKLSVSADTSDTNKMALSFTCAQSYSTMSISSTNSSVLDTLGLGDNSTSYLDVGKTLKDLLGTDSDGNLNNLTANDDGTYDLVINDTKIGSYSSDTALETILSAIKSSDAGVTVSFSKTTNQFLFSAEETGASGQINIEQDTGEENSDGETISNLAAALFGTVNSDTEGYTPGTDAQFTVSINGGDEKTISRSSNNFNIDGLSITLKGTFAENTDDPVTFTTSADADTIVDAVTSMVDDLNAIMKSVHDAYSTQPLTKSDGSSYDPLTDDDESDMTDSAIEAYEEKAKTGLLFGDSDLSSLYSKLLSAVQSSGTAGATLRSMGITTSYSDGLTVLSVDEDTLRDTLETDPDSVRDAFTSTTGTGGLMTNIKSIMDSYASTTGATKGILIQKAGSTYSSLSLLNNTLQDQVDDLDDQIDKWQDKLSDKIDYYTSLFTKLEELTSQLNSQSSLLSGMLGS